jgi:hypothetical protein
MIFLRGSLLEFRSGGVFWNNRAYPISLYRFFHDESARLRLLQSADSSRKIRLSVYKESGVQQTQIESLLTWMSTQGYQVSLSHQWSPKQIQRVTLLGVFLLVLGVCISAYLMVLLRQESTAYYRYTSQVSSAVISGQDPLVWTYFKRGSSAPMVIERLYVTPERVFLKGFVSVNHQESFKQWVSETFSPDQWRFQMRVLQSTLAYVYVDVELSRG